MSERPEQSVINGYVTQLKGQFGRNLDSTVLEAVLEMHNFNYQETEGFLRAENQNSGYDLYNYNPQNANQNETVPQGYYDLPEGFMQVERQAVTISVNTTVKDLFINQSTFEEHFNAQQTKFFEYLANALSLLSAGLEIKDSSKARMLAALWSHKKYQIANYFLKNPNFGLTEVLKAVNLLDSNRKIRVLEKKLGRLQRLPKVKPKTLGKIQSSINDLKREPVSGSLSGALIRHIREWVKQIPQEALNFYILNFPKEPWKELSDLLHLHPSNDLQEPSFLPIIHGKPAPEGSIIHEFSKINSDNILSILEKHKIPYSVLRKQKELITDAIKPVIASYTPLETLIWFYEELSCLEVDKIIQDKLNSGEVLKMGYGKLMERLLTFKGLEVPFYGQMMEPAEKKLKQTKLPLEPPVVCIGDASYSMDVAIRVSTIIASLMTALTNADLLFFNNKALEPPKIPRSIVDVLEVSQTVKADGATAPAAAIFDYYQKKTQIKTFVLVTDEVENVAYEGHYFAQLFYKYRREVYPAQIVIVSFSPNQKVKGRMVKALETMGITPFLELRLDAARPDLTKLDSMLATLSSDSATFDNVVQNVSYDLMQGDLEKKISDMISSF